MQSCVNMLVLLAVQAPLLISSITTSDCPSCGTDWKKIDNEPFCYNYNNKQNMSYTINYSTVVQYCEQQDARLPVLLTYQSRNNFEELVATDFDKFVTNLYSVLVVVGLQGDTSGWKWLDGTPQDLTLLPMNGPFSGGRDVVWFSVRGDFTEYRDYTAYWSSHLVVNVMYCQKVCPIITTIEPEARVSSARVSSASGPGDLQGPSGGGLGTVVIIGIAAGALVLLILVVVCAVVLMKKRRAKGGQSMTAEPSSAVSQEATAKGDLGEGTTTKGNPGEGTATKGDPGEGIATKDLFCGTEMDHGIGTKDLFNATEADHALNASLNL